MMEYLIIHDIHGVYNIFNADYVEDLKIIPEKQGNGAIVHLKHRGSFRYAKFIVSDINKISAQTLQNFTSKLI